MISESKDENKKSLMDLIEKSKWQSSIKSAMKILVNNEDVPTKHGYQIIILDDQHSYGTSRLKLNPNQMLNLIKYHKDKTTEGMETMMEALE